MPALVPRLLEKGQAKSSALGLEQWNVPSDHSTSRAVKKAVYSKVSVDIPPCNMVSWAGDRSEGPHGTGNPRILHLYCKHESVQVSVTLF